jgi:uncharacterized protein
MTSHEVKFVGLQNHTWCCYKALNFMTQKIPIVWLLASPHSGDNTQLFALAENLGWPFEVKHLTYQPWQGVTRLGARATQLGLTPKARKAIAAPFPDLIIAAGHSTESPALWLKYHSGKTIRLVYVGTPLAPLENYDLVITTPQYGLPQQPNVLHIELPMHKVEPHKLKVAAENWRKKLEHLPRPWTAILVGGASGPYTFNAAAAKRLADHAQHLGGSVLISTSARTPAKTGAALAAAVTNPAYFYHWQPSDAENPFFGFLALADQIIVTADSISMLSEAIATDKPVMMFDTEEGPFAMRDENPQIAWRGRSFYATLFRLAMRYAPPRLTRDLRIVHKRLVASGQANWLGEVQQLRDLANEPTALSRATSRVLKLFEL